ncbi:MAG: hypothetical protein J6P60_01945 [Lachnospiraceae bacterium]|nr:hypothetical protein [Lachnospiraceae bacterium]
MREMEFKMERPDVLHVGDRVKIWEGLLPSNYYYVIEPSLAMSPNIPFRERLTDKEGTVVDIKENPRGFYVTVLFESSL